LATVTNSALPSSSSNTLWILPLPYVVSPTRATKRPLSRSAPARISLALALPWLTSTASGASERARAGFSSTTRCAAGKQEQRG